MKPRTTVSAIILCIACLAIGGESKMTSCILQIFNGSDLCGEYNYEDDFDVDDGGTKIPSDGIGGLLTDDAGYSCSEVHSVSRGWAAVVKYNEDCSYDCSFDDKVFWAAHAGYELILLVKTEECKDIDTNDTHWPITSLPIIQANQELGDQLLKYSVPISDIDYAPYVIITAAYFDYNIVWTMVGVAGVTIVVSCICCIAFRDAWRCCNSRGCCLTHWSIRKLPKRKYKKGKELYETCVICQEDFENAELVRVLPCKHIFHSNCVDQWLIKWNKVCPICKREISDERVRNLVLPTADSESAASALTAVTDNSNASDTENVPLLVTMHEPSGYGSVAGNNGERVGDHLLESAVLTTELYHQLRSSSERSDNLSDVELDHSAPV